jgi:MFS superfamily sulfate permease-like transporter
VQHLTLIAPFKKVRHLTFNFYTGIVFSALVHAWDSGSHVDADIETKSMIINGEEKQVKYVKVKGAVFFSSVRKFVNMFHILEDPPTIIIDFEYALIVDHSAVAAIQGITQRFAKVEKQVLLINLCKKSHGRLHRTGDHKVLRRQITPAVHVRDSSDAEVGKVSNVSDTGGTETPPLFDHHTEAHRVENLPMFQATVDTVEHEVDILSQKQGDFSIHDKKEK